MFVAFFVAPAAIAALAACTLLDTGTALDNIWNFKQHAYHQVLRHRIPIGLGLTLFAIVLALAALGCSCRAPGPNSSAL